MQWECSKGHQWFATANDVKNHLNWCNTCNGNKKLTLEAMVSIAKEHGGYCRSKKFVKTRTELEWNVKMGIDGGLHQNQ